MSEELLLQHYLLVNSSAQNNDNTNVPVQTTNLQNYHGKLGFHYIHITRIAHAAPPQC